MRKYFVIDFDDWADAGWVDAGKKEAERQIKKQLGRGAFVKVDTDKIDRVVLIDYAVINDPEELRFAVANGLGIPTNVVYDMRDEDKYTADNTYGYWKIIFRDNKGRTTTIATTEDTKYGDVAWVVESMNNALKKGGAYGVIAKGRYELKTM